MLHGIMFISKPSLQCRDQLQWQSTFSFTNITGKTYETVTVQHPTC